MTAAPAPTRKIESVFRPALVLMFGRTLAFAATFFIPVVLVRIFTPAQFGTYKQLFLVQSTVYLMAQLGMASSLYYFLPLNVNERGRYLANALISLGSAGAVSFIAMLVAGPVLAHWMNNSALTDYLPWIGAYVLLQMAAVPLEIVLISQHRYSWASASYALSDLVRAASFILPAFIFRDLGGLLKGAVLGGVLRLSVALWYFRSEFGSELRPSKPMLRKQIAYAIPFGLAIFLEIAQGSLPQYIVSYLTDPVTFAIFSIGCLQIPLIDFAASPTSDVMMVRMQEHLVRGEQDAVLDIWHDATWKLALFFFPLAGLVISAARQIILLLFTNRYIESVPLFIAWSFTIILTVFQVDGVLRVFAQTRLLVWLNLVRLILIAGLMKLSLEAFHLVGPVLVIVFANAVFKAGGLWRMKQLMRVRTAALLPWKNLASLAAICTVAALATGFVISHAQLSKVLTLLCAGIVYTLVYSVLVWRLNVLAADEKCALTAWLRRRVAGIVRIPDYERAA